MDGFCPRRSGGRLFDSEGRWVGLAFILCLAFVWRPAEAVEGG